MIKKILATVFCSGLLIANANPDPCSQPEASQFDFWVGDWSLTYQDTVHAFNRITKEMDGCVIHEHFDDTSQKFMGQSWSVYNQQQKKWQQTWVDNQGGYFALNGSFEHDQMLLFTGPRKNAEGKSIQNRMIFYNISKNSFDWNWEATLDEGKTWNIKWKIHYERMK